MGKSCNNCGNITRSDCPKGLSSSTVPCELWGPQVYEGSTTVTWEEAIKIVKQLRPGITDEQAVDAIKNGGVEIKMGHILRKTWEAIHGKKLEVKA